MVEEQDLVAQGQGLSLKYHAAGEMAPHIMGDRDQLTRLFANLISNAIQYTAEGSVSVTLEPGQGQPPTHQVTVTDTGIGIPKELQSQVFDRFYRVDKARSRRDGAGSGLGLAIAKAITTNHQGQLHLDSQPGKGTTVTATLPAKPPVK